MLAWAENKANVRELVQVDLAAVRGEERGAQWAEGVEEGWQTHRNGSDLSPQTSDKNKKTGGTWQTRPRNTTLLHPLSTPLTCGILETPEKSAVGHTAPSEETQKLHTATPRDEF